MSKLISIYQNSKDIGNHESHYEKVGKFNCDFVGIVRSVKGKNATVSYNDTFMDLKSGIILGENALVKTNDSYVEIMDSHENIFRLGKNSQFCIEMTIKGLVPVYYGNVHFEPSHMDITSHHKYITSCWIGGKLNVFTIQAISRDIDAYYTYDNPIEVFEFDELGNRFSIVHLEAFQKCCIKRVDGKMRDKYSIIEKRSLTNLEIRELFEEYRMPFNWRETETIKEEKIN